MKRIYEIDETYIDLAEISAIGRNRAVRSTCPREFSVYLKGGGKIDIGNFRPKEREALIKTWKDYNGY